MANSSLVELRGFERNHGHLQRGNDAVARVAAFRLGLQMQGPQGVDLLIKAIKRGRIELPCVRRGAVCDQLELAGVEPLRGARSSR